MVTSDEVDDILGVALGVVVGDPHDRVLYTYVGLGVAVSTMFQVPLPTHFEVWAVFVACASQSVPTLVSWRAYVVNL